MEETALTPSILKKYFYFTPKIRFTAILPCKVEINLLNKEGKLLFDGIVHVKTLEELQLLIFLKFKVTREHDSEYTLQKIKKP